MIPVRTRLRRMHQLLVNSRYALEQASQRTSNRWLSDLLFTISCRRVIMLNELDRELGQMHVPATPPSTEAPPFDAASTKGSDAERYVQLCQAEDVYLANELESLRMERGLHGHTRDAIGSLLGQIREDLADVLFVRQNHSSFQH